MLSVKLVRSLFLGETIINNPFLDTTHYSYDADNDEENDTHLQKPRIKPSDNPKIKNKINKKKMPLLFFIPTKELISDTFRLATIARDIGMDFYPSPSLSHLLFSWPSSPSSSSPSPSSSLLSSSSSSYNNNNRPSVSSTSTSSSSSCTTLSNDAVPIPFPSLSTVSSISLLRSFVSLSKGLFKLVFFEIEPNSRFWNCNYNNYDYNFDCSSNVELVCRVSGKGVNSMEDFSRVLAGNGWSLFRSSEKTKSGLCSLYLFKKMDSHRARVRKMINNGGGGGECRVREMRLPALDFKNGVPLRVLQYILLMTDDIFYLA